jgi:hypothetical protein
MTEILPLHLRTPARRRQAPIFFDRRELQTILDVYSRMVSLGEWRDYGFETGDDGAAFLVYRRASEAPLFRIVKRARPKRRHETYQVVAPGRILKRGEDLRDVLAVFETRRFAVVEER